MQDTSTYKDTAGRYSDADLRKERHKLYRRIRGLLPLFHFSVGRIMIVEFIKAYQAMREAEREAEDNPQPLPPHNPVRGRTLAGLGGNEDQGGLIDHAHTVAAIAPRTTFGPWVGRVVEQSTGTIPTKLIRRLKVALLEELAGKCDAEYTPLRRVLQRILDRDVCHGTWSLGAGDASLRDVYVHGGVRFTDTRVHRAFRELKLNGKDGDDHDDGESSVGACLFDDCSSAVSHLDILDVHHCVCAVSNPPGGVQTVFINGLMYVEPLPPATVNAGFKDGLCTLLLQLLAAHEQCGAWLGVFIMGGKYTRVVVLDPTTIALEVANEPQQWLFDDRAWGCANLPCYAYTCDELWPVPDRITTPGAYFTSPIAHAQYFPNNLGVGWGIADLEVNVTTEEDEEGHGLQTLLDVFNVAALGVAGTRRRPLWMPPSTPGHRAGEILKQVAQYRRTGVYTKLYPDEDDESHSENERNTALAYMVAQIRNTVPHALGKRKRAQDCPPPKQLVPTPAAVRVSGDARVIVQWRETVAASGTDSDPPTARTPPNDTPPADPEAPSLRLGEHPDGVEDPSPEQVLTHLGVVLVLLNRRDMNTVIAQRAAVP